MKEQVESLSNKCLDKHSAGASFEEWRMTLANGTRDRFLAQAEILLQIIELTDLPTVMALRTVTRQCRDLIDQYRNIIARALIQRLEHYRSIAEPEVPETWDYLMRLQTCNDLAAICAARDRQPDNLYIGQEGVPATEPLGDGLRLQIAKGFLVMWKFSEMASIRDQISHQKLSALLTSSEVEALTSETGPVTRSISAKVSPYLNSGKWSSAELIECLRKFPRDADLEHVRDALHRLLWINHANSLSDEEVIAFLAAWRRIPEDFQSTDFPGAQDYTNKHAWNFLPAMTELEAEFWYHMQILRRSPRLVYDLWQDKDDDHRSRAWLRLISRSRAINEQQISWAVETRRDLMRCSKLFSYRLREIADQDFRIAMGRWMMGRYPETYAPDRDPAEVHIQCQLNICVCFGGGVLDTDERQKRWVQRPR